MTKLTELLSKAGRRETEPLGFGRGGKRTERTPDILLIGRINEGDLSTLDTERTPVDAFLLEMGEVDAKVLASATKALQDDLWGVSVKTVTVDGVRSLKESGADFILFAASNTPASVLSEEDTGAFLIVAPDLDDEEAQAVHGLPIDGVAVEVDANSFPLTVETLMRLHRPLTTGAHAIVISNFDPTSLSTRDLDAMRGAAISALALPAAGEAGLQALSEAIADLPEPKSAHDDRLALIPHASLAGGGEDYDDEDGDY